ncbi:MULTISPECIES: LysR family transcriptional regulator [unclassified Bradyrhizobium]|uniref:LysR family transcriptional regulator n=1 Tax=unclassified Bradyrhizobium TaxID=2631580 RepID=UPI0024792403|nr:MULTISPECIES: LysR family transcriptional regulator [unclassified Bradyrhizobium]WGS19674.1 LysR family transcriptional regulator [Bradyrhizobium sp. ISRA463]WGS26516.1 LysR family transcriptional regulator [Bradyrhizobium sp. ISRA464]
MRRHLPLNALRAFEASARLLSFTRAGLELRVTQTAISHQVKQLEDMLGASLFRRLPRGLVLTDEGLALLPVLSDALNRIGAAIERIEAKGTREVVTVGCVATFATGWLLQRVERFKRAHPYIDLRLLTNNNRVDIAGDGLDLALRFGDGSWHGTEAIHLLAAPLSPMCRPDAAGRLRKPADLAKEVLLRSYRAEEWPLWFAVAGSQCPKIQGPIFDSSVAMAEAAARGVGVGLVPVAMFQNELASGRLVRPFAAEVPAGSYWLTWLKSKDMTPGMRAFRDWMLDTLRADADEAEDAMVEQAPAQASRIKAKPKTKAKAKAAKKRRH